MLLGHAPVEISHILHHFLAEHLQNRIVVTITGARKREVGLVVPAKYKMYTLDKRCDTILNNELIKLQKTFTTLELKYTEKLRHYTVPISVQL